MSTFFCLDTNLELDPYWWQSSQKAPYGRLHWGRVCTSNGTPFVSGTIALMLDASPGLTLQQVKNLLQQSAEDWGSPGQDIDYGWGRLDSYRAVARAGNLPETGAPPVPGHISFTGSLASTGQVANHTFQITDTSYPLNVTLLMGGTGGAPDLDLFIYNPAGVQIGKSTTVRRQDQVALAVNQTGTYRVEVKRVAGSGDGSYVVDVSAGLTGGGPPPDAEPSVSVREPSEGATVAGVVGVLIDAADDHGIDRVEVAIDGGAYQPATPDGGAYRFSWDSRTVANGAHRIHVRAFDSAGQQAQAQRNVNVQNQDGGPGQQQWVRTGQVTPAARDAEFTLNVSQPGYVDFTLGWPGSSDLDLYVYAPDGTLAGRAFTVANPERLRIDTVRYGAGAYRVRVNLYSGAAASFTLTAAGYQRVTQTGTVTTGNRNSTHLQVMDFTGQSRIELGWPGSADLDFFVYDPSGRERARAFTLNNPEVRDFPVDVTGNWSVRVNLYSGATTSYALHWFVPAAVLS